MRKIIENYNFLKENNNRKKYLFESGMFYIFVDNDAREVSRKFELKLTSFGNNVKCGFPINAFVKYEKLLCNENIELVTKETIENKLESLIALINKVDVDNLTPMAALHLVTILKEKTKNE